MRTKKSNLTYQNRRDFEKAVDHIGKLVLEVEHEKAEHNERKALEDKAHKLALKRKQDKIKALYNECEMYADLHREELLGEKQSSETSLSFFGYRKSPGVVKTLSSKWTLGKAIEAIKLAGKGLSQNLLKVTETLDKNAVKKHLSEEEMARYGLRLEVKEEFWVDPKRAEKLEGNKIKTSA